MSLSPVTVLDRITIRWFSYGYSYYVSSHMSQLVVVTRIVRSKAGTSTFTWNNYLVWLSFVSQLLKLQAHKLQK